MSNLNINKREELLSTISDMYKDAFGVRPHACSTSILSKNYLKRLIRLRLKLKSFIEHEQKTDALLITKFNEEVETFIHQGADRFTAIR